MHEELEVVSSETGETTGVSLPRHEVINQGLWCRSTNVFVIDAAGRILCHQRSMQKERMPGVWVTHVGGHVSRGETFETNALKELEEEAGLTVSPKQLFAWRTTRIPSSRLWAREFVALYDGVSTLVPQPGEVDRFEWFHIDEILESKKSNPDAWCAGTHDFRVEYACLRAALAAAHNVGAHTVPSELMVWGAPQLSGGIA